MFLRMLFQQEGDGSPGGGGTPAPPDSPPASPNPDDSTPAPEEPKEGDKDKIEGLETELNGVMRELSLTKKDRDGQARKLSSMQKELDNLRKAHMDEAERLAVEAKEREAEFEANRIKEREALLAQGVALAGERCGLAEKDLFLLNGGSIEDVSLKGKRLKELLAESFEQGRKAAAKELLSKGPPAGTSPEVQQQASPEALVGANPLASLDLATQRALGK